MGLKGGEKRNSKKWGTFIFSCHTFCRSEKAYKSDVDCLETIPRLIRQEERIEPINKIILSRKTGGEHWNQVSDCTDGNFPR